MGVAACAASALVHLGGAGERVGVGIARNRAIKQVVELPAGERGPRPYDYEGSAREVPEPPEELPRSDRDG